MNYPNWLVVFTLSAADFGIPTVAECIQYSARFVTAAEGTESTNMDDSNTLESRLDQGVEVLEPCAEADEDYIDNEEDRMGKEVLDYEEKIANQVLMSLKSGM